MSCKKLKGGKKLKRRKKGVFVTDCDGTMANSIPELFNGSIECIGNFFPVEGIEEKAEELVAHFGGESFASGLKRALESLFPGKENEEKREKCYKAIAAKRIEIYDKVKPFPGTIEAVKKLAKRYHLVVSSGLEHIILDSWLEKNGLGKDLFKIVYGLEDGKKDIHVQLVRKKFPGAKVFYAGDSIAEMKLGDFAIGVARRPWHQELLLRGGAWAVISSFKEILNIL